MIACGTQKTQQQTTQANASRWGVRGQRGWEGGKGAADLLHGGASIHGAALVPVRVVPHPVLWHKGSLAHLSRLQHMILIRVLE